MSRFTEATQEPYDIISELVAKEFPNLAGARFEVIFDTKKRKSGNRLVFGRIQATGDLLQYLSSDKDNPEGVDYIMYLDANLWENMDNFDKKRLVYHELCHCEVDLDKKKPYGIKDHSIQMFEEEIDYNSDDPKWTMRLATMLESLYDGN